MVMDPTLPRISVRDLMMQDGSFRTRQFRRTNTCKAPFR